MEEGFVKGQSDNLPNIDIYTVMEFFTSNPSFVSAEIKGVKLLNEDVDGLRLRARLDATLTELLGAAGAAATSVDVLRAPAGGRAILRVPSRQVTAYTSASVNSGNERCGNRVESDALHFFAASARVMASAKMAERNVITDGKDTIIIASSLELSSPSRVELPAAPRAPGLVLPDGRVNWGCPCLGGMATGPCAEPFRDAFSCFHYSETEPKGSDCYEKFSLMQQCMAEFPRLYGKDDDEDDALGEALSQAEAAAPPASKPDAQT